MRHINIYLRIFYQVLNKRKRASWIMSNNLNMIDLCLLIYSNHILHDYI